jgi:hypothetical protein
VIRVIIVANALRPSPSRPYTHHVARGRRVATAVSMHTVGIRVLFLGVRRYFFIVHPRTKADRLEGFTTESPLYSHAYTVYRIRVCVRVCLFKEPRRTMHRCRLHPLDRGRSPGFVTMSQNCDIKRKRNSPSFPRASLAT